MATKYKPTGRDIIVSIASAIVTASGVLVAPSAASDQQDLITKIAVIDATNSQAHSVISEKLDKLDKKFDAIDLKIDRISQVK